MNIVVLVKQVPEIALIKVDEAAAKLTRHAVLDEDLIVNK